MAKNDDNTLDIMGNVGNNAIDLINRLDVATGKVQPGRRRGSIVKSAQGNVFEFPVFVSNSVPLDYATATVSLLEQLYATYIQMAVSMNPVIDASSVKNGLQFANYKTNTNKYLEYTETDFQHEACHNVIQEDGTQFEFDMLSIEDHEARLINEAVDYQPLSEFSHFFQEAEITRNDMLTLYPYPRIITTPQGNKIVDIRTDRTTGADVPPHYNVIDPKNTQYGTIDEIEAYLNKEKCVNTNNALRYLDNTLRHYNIAAISAYDVSNAQSESDARLMTHVRNICGSMTIDEFKDQNNTDLRQMVNDLNKRNPGFRNSMFATMRAVEQTVDNANLENQRINAQINQAKASTASQNASAQKTGFDIADIPDAPTYADAVAAHRKSQVAKSRIDELNASDAMLDASKRSALAKADLDELAAADIPIRDEEGNVIGHITPEDVERAKRESVIAKSDLDKLAVADIPLRDAEGNVIGHITPEEVEYARRKSVLAKAAVDSRNAKKATSPYYNRLEDISAGAGTVRDVAGAINTTAQAVGNIATLPSSIRHAKNQVELDKQQIALNKDKLDNLEADRSLRKTEVFGKMKTSNIEYIDDSKCAKLNTMKPLLMRVTVNMLNKDDSLQPINYIIGVKTHTRVIPASILPEVAKYPLKEMDKVSRKIKWRAGELKFLKDLVFRIKEKKQTAADSRDPNRKWYRRLYELAHMKGDAPSTAVIQGKSIFAAFIRDKQGKSKLMHGFIPNASIIISKADVDNVKRMTEIDLLKSSTARNFCGELFLISLVVIDTDAQSLKIMMPDQNSGYDVHSLASVEKQISTLSTAGSKTRDMFKLLG